MARGTTLSWSGLYFAFVLFVCCVLVTVLLSPYVMQFLLIYPGVVDTAQAFLSSAAFQVVLKIHDLMVFMPNDLCHGSHWAAC